MVKGVLPFRTRTQRTDKPCSGTFGLSPRYKPMSIIARKTLSKRAAGRHLDHRDRLILALYAQLRAERETREALEWAIENEALSPQVLQAMASDPVPAITSEDVAALERLLARDTNGGTPRH